jgi:hypothetical protein
MTVRSLYFVNWWVDMLIIGGLSILTWVVLLAFYRSADTQPIFWLSLVLSLVANYPHFSATVYRLYQSPDNIRQFPVTAYGLPLILFGAVAASFWQPNVIAPYLLMLFLLWSPYHYSGQTIGLTMVYARRAGFSIGRRERMALSAFVFSAFVCGVIRFQRGGLTDFYGMSIPTFPLPDWMDAAAQAVMWTGALVFAGFAVVWCLGQKRLMPPIVLPLLPFAAIPADCRRHAIEGQNRCRRRRAFLASAGRRGKALGIAEYAGRHVAFHWASGGVQLAASAADDDRRHPCRSGQHPSLLCRRRYLEIARYCDFLGADDEYRRSRRPRVRRSRPPQGCRSLRCATPLQGLRWRCSLVPPVLRMSPQLPPTPSRQPPARCFWQPGSAR